jgi:hypothetical protein
MHGHCADGANFRLRTADSSDNGAPKNFAKIQITMTGPAPLTIDLLVTEDGSLFPIGIRRLNSSEPTTLSSSYATTNHRTCTRKYICNTRKTE